MTPPGLSAAGLRRREPREPETPGAPVVLRPRRPARSNQAYVLCFLALLARSHLELDALALLEVAVAIHLNRGVVNEHVGACFSGNEAVALLAVEPLHGSGSCHLAPIKPAHARCRGPASISWSSSLGCSNRRCLHPSVRPTVKLTPLPESLHCLRSVRFG